jgi:uncharacterized repeat protein (TIGR04076 family)
MPNAGVLGDAFTKELVDRGLNIITTDETAAMVGGIRINQLGVTAREYYAALREKGVDAVLTASARMAKDGICMSALYSFMPKVFALHYGADFPWLKDNKDVSTHACPDANNPVVFEIRRIRD